MFTEGEEMYLQGEQTSLFCHAHMKIDYFAFGYFPVLTEIEQLPAPL